MDLLGLLENDKILKKELIINNQNILEIMPKYSYVIKTKTFVFDYYDLEDNYIWLKNVKTDKMEYFRYDRMLDLIENNRIIIKLI